LRGLRNNVLKIKKTNWEKHVFSDIAVNISERVDPMNTDLEIYVGLEHIDGEMIHLKRLGKKSDVKGTKLRCYPGDVIFGRRRAYLRKAALVDFNGFCSAHSLVLRANPDVIHPRLFPFFLHSNVFMDRAVKISVGSLSPTINWGTLKEQQFHLPPKEKQSQLAEFLWSSTQVIDKTYELRKKNDIFTNVALKSLLLGQESNEKGELKHISRIGDIPKDWTVVTMSSVFDRIVQKNKNLESDNVLTISAQQGLVNQEEYFTRKIASKNLKGYYLISEGEFVYNKSYSEGFPAGVIKSLDKYKKGVVSPLYICFKPKESSELNVYYKHLFNFGFLNQQILSIAKEGARNHGLLNVSANDFFNLKIPLPCEGFISSVLEKIDSIFLNGKIIDEYYKANKELNKSLINQIFDYDV